jgi:glc operon protein GlcG
LTLDFPHVHHAGTGRKQMRTKLALTLDDAKKLMAAAEEEATRNKWEVVIAILNDGGRIVAVHRMDGARPGNDQIAIAKATTSAMTCRPSAVWERWIEGPHKAYATFPFIAAQGGLPIIIDGDLIGAIGVSGVKSSEDEQIAMAAIKAVFPQAKTTRAGEENDAQTF